MTPDILAALAPPLATPTDRRVLVVPVLPGLRPGAEAYEEVVGPLRDRVGIVNFTVPFGPLDEESLVAYGGLLELVGWDERAIEDEGTLRTRAWLDAMTPEVDRFVLLSYLPARTLRPWSRAMAFCPAASKTTIVTMTERQRITDPGTRDRLHRALGLVRRETRRDDHE